MDQKNKKISPKTKQKKTIVYSTVLKLLNSLLQVEPAPYHYRIKMLEINNIKTLEANKMGISAAQNLIKNRLEKSSLSNKQKAEVLLVAQIEAHRVVDGLIQSMEDTAKE